MLEVFFSCNFAFLGGGMIWTQSLEVVYSSCVIVAVAGKCALVVAKTKCVSLYHKDNPLLVLHKLVLKTTFSNRIVWGRMVQAVSPCCFLCCTLDVFTLQPCTMSTIHLKPDKSLQAARLKINPKLSVGLLKWYVHKGKSKDSSC